MQRRGWSGLREAQRETGPPIVSQGQRQRGRIWACGRKLLNQELKAFECGQEKKKKDEQKGCHGESMSIDQRPEESLEESGLIQLRGRARREE